jgi:hypothetical protein
MAFLTQGSIELGVDTFLDFVPKRFALKYRPPKIVLEYLIPSNGKLYIHYMKIRPNDLCESPEILYQKLKQKHSYYLDPSKVSETQVIELIKLLQKGQSQDDIIL